MYKQSKMSPLTTTLGLGGLGALGGLGTAALVDYAVRSPNSEQRTWSEWLRDLTPTAIATGALGGTVGLGLLHNQYSMARGVDGKPEVGILRALLSTPERMKELSPSYKLRADRQRANRRYIKNSNFSSFAPGSPEVFKVDAFNKVVWNDASMGLTDPVNALKVTTAVNAASGGLPIVSPVSVVNTLANAGIGYATANAIGKTLGAMGVMSPTAQSQLRSVGIWGGVINGLGQAIR